MTIQSIDERLAEIENKLSQLGRHDALTRQKLKLKAHQLQMDRKLLTVPAGADTD